jgi:carbon monoxide dehydrogenase subunit G
VDLTHSFTVPAGVDQTWRTFLDIEDVASCFPGATVTSVEGDDFTGTCKVKLGPIALLYTGSGTFLERDETAHRFVVEAKGKDRRGNGTAGATVVAVMTQGPDGSTDVEVTTNLSITGKPAQFGRGVIQDVSDKLLQQFVTCLESKVGAPEGAGAPAEGGTAPDVAPVEVPVPASAATGGPQPAPSSPGPRSGIGSGSGSGGQRELTGQPTGQESALDLGATVLPVLVKAYWKQLAGGLLALLLLRKLLGRGR